MSQYRDPEQYTGSQKQNTGDTINSLFDAVERAEENASVPAPKPKSLVDEAWEHLYSAKCICGGKKEIKQSFCRFCYWELPRKLRNALWTPMSAGYAEHYDEARQWLLPRIQERAERKRATGC